MGFDVLQISLETTESAPQVMKVLATSESFWQYAGTNLRAQASLLGRRDVLSRKSCLFNSVATNKTCCAQQRAHHAELSGIKNEPRAEQLPELQKHAGC